MATVAAPPAPLRVLVVEDELCIRDIYCRTLASAGHRPDAADSAYTARRILARRSFDCILLDLRLENAEAGLRLLADLKACGSTRTVPVLAMTGVNALFDDLGEALRLGAADTFIKPIMLSELREKVARLRPVPSRRRARLLVVEDDAGQQDLYREFLLRNSDAFVGTLAPSRKAALAALAEDGPPFDAAVIDWNMDEDPDAGLMVLRALSGDPRTRGALAVVVTGSQEERVLQMALCNGAHDFLRKPWSPADLAARLKGRLAARAVLRHWSRIPLGRHLVLDLTLRRLTAPGWESGPLSESELTFLELLAVRKVVTREDAARTVYGTEWEGKELPFNSMLARLRKRFPPGLEDIVETLPRVGLRIKEGK